MIEQAIKSIINFLYFALPVICYTVYRVKKLKYGRIELNHCKVNRICVKQEEQP